ncbi:hypothetical protein ACUUMA_02345 [Paenarthrobacter nitroguajacolicus]
MSKATSDLLSHFEAKEVEGSPPGPSWNVAPTQNVPIMAERLSRCQRSSSGRAVRIRCALS